MTSMALNIRDLRLNQRIEAIAKVQPTPLERAVMARSMLDAACEACEQTGNPLAWMQAAIVPAPTTPASAQQIAGQSSTIRENSPTPRAGAATPAAECPSSSKARQRKTA